MWYGLALNRSFVAVFAVEVAAVFAVEVSAAVIAVEVSAAVVAAFAVGVAVG